MSKIVLKVRNKSYENWEAIHVGKSLLQIAGEFGFSTTDIFGYDPEKWDIKLGDPCTVEVDDQLLITGYIEDMPISYDKETHTIQIAGRDKTGNLVDCSYIETPNEWKRQSIFSIISSLCEPFDISVVVNVTVTDEVTVEIPTFKADEGETVYELISRLCRHKAILPVCYGDGYLTLTRAGASYDVSDNLELGVNIKSGMLDWSDRERFSKYIVKGQDVVTDDSGWDSGIVSRYGEATDQTLVRKKQYRPLIIFSERATNDKECEDRAKWEASVRAGQSRKVEYEVQGWVQRNGIVWPLNSLVTVKDKALGIDGPMLISALEFNVDNMTGTVTKLTVVPKETFTLIEEAIKIGDEEKSPFVPRSVYPGIQ